MSIQDNLDFNRYASMAEKYLNPSSAGAGVPALTATVSVVLTIFYIASLFNDNLVEKMCLFPDALFSLPEFPRLNTYPLVHAGFLHIFFNLVSLWAPMAQFETLNGTFHTALVLSALSLVTAISYCLLGFYFFPDTSVLGCSGWVFSFIAYFSYVNSLQHKTIRFFGRFDIPTITVPFVFLGFVFLMVPNSSFVGHLLGIIAGFVMAKGFLVPLTVLPMDLISKVEVAAHKLIELIPHQLHYIRESDVKNGRYKYDNLSLPLYTTDAAVPMASGDARVIGEAAEAGEAGSPETFKGPGHVLGTSS
ncbi:hypothetical protein FOA43_000124 [Brettanomyces nanus]|uniref:Rhomboid-type serine protease 2 n=1 Tax=Eeniella nana TaxID=13502 RepID=A0A875RY43_EENNA|nr:uncharacterized protein FOA43_000124 [Brettanomyces nanus]QPG72822.1 hypothetical protein FOA43_000124 [Brettanomyces nanus]